MNEVDTKDRLSQSFKTLVSKKPFNKITIKNITDEANVIRPTFYNHFQDNNEVFEYILEEELFDSLDNLVEVGLVDEAVTMLFVCFDKNKTFYRHAFETEGQNSFEETLTEQLKQLFKKILEPYQEELDAIEELKVFGGGFIVRYYSVITVFIIKAWLQGPNKYEVSDIIQAYKFLARHSIIDIIEKIKR